MNIKTRRESRKFTRRRYKMKKGLGSKMFEVPEFISVILCLILALVMAVIFYMGVWAFIDFMWRCACL